LYRVLVPGGQVELVEANLCSNGTGPASKKLNGLISALTARYNFGFGRVSILNQKLAAAGFTKITRTIRPLRVGKWAGTEGICARRYYRMSIRRLQPHFECLGVTAEELDATLDAWEDECESQKNIRLVLFYYLAIRPPNQFDTVSISGSLRAPSAAATISAFMHRSGGSISRGFKKRLMSIRSSIILPRDDKSDKASYVSPAHCIYMMPKSAEEKERLERQHTMLLHFLGTLYMAPVKKPKHVLDVGTGTGCWAKVGGKDCLCFQGADVFSDRVWFRNILSVKYLDATMTKVLCRRLLHRKVPISSMVTL
jgi:hypothetical protein